MNPQKIVASMSPTMIKALHQVEASQGAALHGRERSSLESRGLIGEDLYESITLTETGRAILNHLKENHE